MASVVLNGVTYTDDSNPATGMGNGGHRVRFIPSLSNFLIEADDKISEAEQQVQLAAQQVSLAAQQVSLAASQVNLAAQQVTLAEDHAENAEGFAISAENSASLAASASLSAGYAGVWEDLTGSLLSGVSVAHEGQLWALTENLTDVTLSEPGYSPVWYPLGGVNAADTLFINFFLG